ncbi:MAG: TIGR00725 family protein, partial [Acidobacteria bacterium]|nr:TIGR00725 family protein [Acidobacteriota bacterium]
MLIGVIGGKEADDDSLALAYAVGREIASRGHVLVCGGRGGVMREACRGAKDGGGLTVGILPGDDLSDANEFVDIPVITGLGFARNTIIARTANALIAVDGHYGTLSEIAFGLTAGRPIVWLRTWELRDGQGREPPIERVSSAAEA